MAASCDLRHNRLTKLWALLQHKRCRCVHGHVASVLCGFGVCSSCGKPTQVAQSPLPKGVNRAFAIPYSWGNSQPVTNATALRADLLFIAGSRVSTWTSWKDILDFSMTTVMGRWKQSYF